MSVDLATTGFPHHLIPICLKLVNGFKVAVHRARVTTPQWPKPLVLGNHLEKSAFVPFSKSRECTSHRKVFITSFPNKCFEAQKWRKL